MSWKDVLKKEPENYGRLISDENKRIIGQVKDAFNAFDVSQKMLRNGAEYIVKLHPLIKYLPLAAMFPIIRGTGIGPAIKNSVYVVSNAMLRYADHRDVKQSGLTKQMVIDIMDKIKEAEVSQ